MKTTRQHNVITGDISKWPIDALLSTSINVMDHGNQDHCDAHTHHKMHPYDQYVSRRPIGHKDLINTVGRWCAIRTMITVQWIFKYPNCDTLANKTGNDHVVFIHFEIASVHVSSKMRCGVILGL